MQKQKIKKNKGPAPYEAEGFRSGFVILFAMMISSIILAITLGVTKIALKETQFSISAKDTNEAFFAADVGAECVLIYDNDLDTNPFTGSNPDNQIKCGGNIITLNESSSPWDFIIPNLGGEGKGCAKVIVKKIPDADGVLETTVTSRGYNLGGDGECNSGSSNLVERELEVQY